MKNIIKFLLCVTMPLTIGSIAGIATATSIDNWYVTLNKPVFNPPNYLFGPVWTLLYILMGISFYMIIQSPKTQQRKKAIIIFCIQLFLNFCWSFLFFKFHVLGLAFSEILCIWISVLTMIVVFYKINKPSAYMQVPYLLWVSFASVLNGAIWWIN